MILTKKILGTPKKRIGDVVFADWNGLTTARTYNPSPANPQTDSQTSNRNKFTLMNSLAKKFAAATQIGLKRALAYMTHRNAFVKINSGNGLVGLVNGVWDIVDKNALELSRGSLSVPQNIGATYLSGTGQIAISWQDANRNGNDRSDDKVCIVAQKVGGEEDVFALRVADRADGAFNLVFPVALNAGDTVAIYLFMNSKVGTNCSPTSFYELTV